MTALPRPTDRALSAELASSRASPALTYTGDQVNAGTYYVTAALRRRRKPRGQ